MIFSYSGKPGGGKTYEAFKTAVLAKLAEGRNVVTNIVGLDEDTITGYIIDKLGKEPEKIGKLVCVTDDQVIADDFFYYKGAQDGETTVQPGDVVVIDEVWRVFKDVKKIGERRESFIAEHRHFVGADGKPCELHVINQDVSEIPKFIKNRLEACYEMTKLSAVGANNRYRVDVFSSPKMYKKQLLGTSFSKYESEIYQLYKSFDGNFKDFGKLDNRTNGFRSPKFIGLSILLVLIVVFKGPDIFNFFTHGTTDVDIIEQQKQALDDFEALERGERKSELKSDNKDLNNNIGASVKLSRDLYLCGKHYKNGVAYAVVCQYKGNKSYKTDKPIVSDDGLPYVIMNNLKIMDYFSQNESKSLLK
ncbi:zonular occludens toxin domain-containing protein [Aggregatibacter kilianii]|uniref:zonular occludens toxin domain-containing protein n=1 Tax=Aggregatibacter kilianii TaxID=2025884 RepID=UPI000D648744|nr:zonular occludens toxin domain-containing protein [Aggregatibacter kilianii]